MQRLSTSGRTPDAFNYSVASLTATFHEPADIADIAGAIDRRSSPRIERFMRASPVIGVVVFLVFAGCSRDKTSSSSSSSPSSPSANAFSNYTAPRQSGGSGSADVTYKPGVHVVEQKEGTDALISVSTYGSTLVFDRSRGGFPELKDGDVFVIKGLLARKVLASMTNGNELAVLTIPAGLVDIITDGKIPVPGPRRKFLLRHPRSSRSR